MAQCRRPGRRRSLRQCSVAAAGALAVGLTLAACGSAAQGGAADQTSQQAVNSAISALGKQSSLSVRVSIPITPERAQQLSKKGGQALTPAQAQTVASGSLLLTERTGHGEALDSTQAQTDQANSYSVSLTVGSDTPVDVRYVGQSLYVRVQASKLASDVGQSPSRVSGLQSSLAQANLLVPGPSALGQDQWVEISHASLESLAPLRQAESQVGNLAGLEASATRLGADLGRALSANSTVARTVSSRAGDGYSVTVDAHGLLTALAPDIQSTLGALPKVGSSITSKINNAEGSIPAGQTAVIDVYVSNGALHQVDVDLNQFAGSDKVDFPVPLRLVFGFPGEVSAPTGAVQLDLSKLPSLFQGLTGGGSSSS